MCKYLIISEYVWNGGTTSLFFLPITTANPLMHGGVISAGGRGALCGGWVFVEGVSACDGGLSTGPVPSGSHVLRKLLSLHGPHLPPFSLH